MFFLFLYFSLCLPPDPLYSLQYNINNHGQYFGVSGEDIGLNYSNVDLDGRNVPITVIDDGCYYEHVDLLPHFELSNSFNYRTFRNEPFEPGNDHGTAFAGIAAGSMNGFCGVGVAYNATLRCFNLKANFTRPNLIDSINRNNANDGKPQIKVFGMQFGCNGSLCEHTADDEIQKSLDQAPDNVIFIASAGSDSTLGGDSNFNQILQHPRVIVVADMNNRGARSAWTNRGSNILISAPAGGSSSLVDIKFPSLPGLSSQSTTACSNTSDPVGSGAATVAGVVALMLQNNPNLDWRSVQASIILTAAITDYNHPSWTPNGAKNPLYFSHVYGFGRINAENAINLASSIPWPKQTSEKVDAAAPGDLNNYIPTMRRGSFEVTFTVGTSVKMTEYVVLELTLENVDYSTLRIQLTSPRGTIGNVKFYSVSSNSSNNKETKTYKYTIRNYFGASPEGNWKLHLVNDGVGAYGKFISASLTVYGTDQEIPLPHFQVNGTNPYASFPNEPSINIDVNSNHVACGSKINISVSNVQNTSLLFTMTDSKRRSRWPIASRTIIEDELKELRLPCYFKNNESMIIVAENDKEEIWGESKPLAVQNNQENFILLYPSPYQTFYYDPDASNQTLDIRIVPSMNMDYWIDGGAAQHALITLFDLEKEQTIWRENIVLGSYASIQYNNPITCHQCLLSLVLSWHYPFSDCSQMIQPISILKKGDLPDEPFGLKLNDKCPIPDGIYVTEITPTPIPDNNTTKIVPTIVGSVFLFVFIGLVVIFFVFNRDKNDEESLLRTTILE